MEKNNFCSRRYDMEKRTYGMLVFLFLLILYPHIPVLGDEKADKPAFEITGSISEYGIRQNNSCFGDTSSAFLEHIVRFGIEADLTDSLDAVLQMQAQNTAGDAEDYTGVTTDDWIVEPELAYIKYSDIMGKPFSLTLGRQNLGYGDGFIVWDGYSDPRAPWIHSVRSFYAVKGVYEFGDITLDAFAAAADRDFGSFETFFADSTVRTGIRELYGVNVHMENAGEWDFGIFYKDDGSKLRSDTLALSQRGSYTFDNMFPALTIEGELVEEFGSTRVSDYTLTGSKHDRQAFGGHLDIILSFDRVKTAPYLLLSYIYLQGDDPDTDENEAFDPMFRGSSDWGKWYIGTIGPSTLFNFNQKIAMIEAGMTPLKDTSLRIQYFYSMLDREITAGGGTRWSQELDLIFSHEPDDYFSWGVELGAARPMKAAEEFTGGDRITAEIVVFANLTF